MGVFVINAMSRSIYPGKDSVPMVQEAGQAPGPVRTVVDNLAPPGFDHQTLQPVASRYTDYAIPAPKKMIVRTQNFGRRLRFFFRIASVTFLRPFVLCVTYGFKFHFLYGI